mmetsp:Transcript_4065/g.11489  ORF Transcript_4065/g.11489 Transcript_4065/m.11489 type:complete len:223 (+) Transcript_4065:195-863(+)|eukprot:CAMPEP_0117672396 /NCGR_PEP_ID=MMETSP0804-20121206/13882_1 /TAXON_ID=1074897 /ORGANISM="Tetraselmis astigmatica, Strain CCMP880" /LENGTH=222 /DNA_ID=CAMNT_0005480995 /DNA_START=170 /DNA_END=838 /DNA_ORIENTATION=-
MTALALHATSTFSVLVALFLVSTILVVSPMPINAGSGVEHAFQAARTGQVEQVLKAVEVGDIGINYREKGSGQTLLMAASLAGQAEVVRSLLKQGADWRIGEKDGYTPMHGAAFQGRDDVAEVLLEAGVPPSGGEPHRDGYHPIFRAVWGMNKRPGHLRFVQLMIDDGHVDINIKDANGRNLIAHALERQHYDIAKFLRVSGIQMTPEQLQRVKGSKFRQEL